MQEWYWCLRHERVESQEEACPADVRLGPFPTAEAAAGWKQTFSERDEAWQHEDEDWERGEPQR